MAILLAGMNEFWRWGDLAARLAILRSCFAGLERIVEQVRKQDIQCWCSRTHTSVQVSAGPTRLGWDDRINKIIPNTYV
jgi:hypothetical protein